MTLGITSAVALSDPTQKVKNSVEQLELSRGDVFEASVVDLRDSSISIAVDSGVDQKIIDLQISKELDLNVNDRIEVEVLKAGKDVLQLSIRKIDEEKAKVNKNNNAVSNSINLDEVKKSIISTNNPLQYSSQLDNHIEHAIAQVESILESFSDAEMTAIIKENYDTTKMTIDLLYQVGHSNQVDKKIALADDLERSVSITVNEDKINKLIDEVNDKNILTKTSKETIELIVKELMNNNLAIEPKNVEKLINFVEKVDKVKAMSSKDIVQFLSSNKESTINELYKSLFISQKNVKKDMISEQDYKEIEQEVVKIVNQAFENEVFNNQLSKDQKEKALQDIQDIAKSLVKKNIPIDERAIETIKFVKQEFTREEIVNLGVIQLKKQEKPEQLLVTENLAQVDILSKEEINALTNLINKVSKNDIEAVVLKNRTITFHELEVQVEEMEEAKINEVDKNFELDKNEKLSKDEVKIEQTKVVSTTNQQVIDKNTENLQIIRYQMTYKAAMSLSIQGVDLKNTSLQVIRERIESFEVLHIEENKLLDKKIEVEGVKSSKVKIDNNETVNLSKKELAVLEVKKHMALISGSSTRTIASVAIQNVNQTEEISLASLAKTASLGADRYDELRTMPRSDLGDNIEKAFANVKDILDDLNLENSTFNQRAVEILGRNEMPMTTENIEAVKALDIELQELFTKLMPEHVKSLVDLQVDILNEPIESLVEFVRNQNQFVQKDMDEQVAKHIMAMLKNNEITQEQKDVLVGVYRMIHTIENSKGAAVGFLLNNKLDVTLESLFDASKMIRQTQKSDRVIDASINDSFGKLESINREQLTIKQQIQMGYFEKEMDMDALIAKVLKGNIEKIAFDSTGNLANNQMSHGVSKDYHQELQMIQSIVEQEETLELKDMLNIIQKMQKSQLKESLSMNSKSSLNEIKAFADISKNPVVFKDMLNEFAKLSVDFEPLREKLSDKMTEFINNLTPKGQEVFEKGVKEILDEAKEFSLKEFLNKQNDDLLNKDQVMKQSSMFSGEKTMHQLSKDIESQLSLQKQLIEQEDYYSVPVMINGEMQHMSMYYFRQDNEVQNTQDDMSIYFSFSTKNLGSANIRVQLKGDESVVTMYATKDEGNRQMKSYEEDFKNLFTDVGLSINKMKYDTFLLPTPVSKDQKVATANKVKKYNNNLFEKIV